MGLPVRKHTMPDSISVQAVKIALEVKKYLVDNDMLGVKQVRCCSSSVKETVVGSPLLARHAFPSFTAWWTAKQRSGTTCSFLDVLEGVEITMVASFWRSLFWGIWYANCFCAQ
jgi:hypothetical protein